MPYSAAAYIARLAASNKHMHEEFEERRKYYQHDATKSGSYSSDVHIEPGKRVVHEYNDSILCNTDKIKFIVTIKRKIGGCVG